MENSVNVNLLKGKTIERGTNVSGLTSKDPSNLYRKLQTGGGRITIDEAREMAKRLKLSDEEIINIFFANIVA